MKKAINITLFFAILAINASAQLNYTLDRVYTGNQVSNTVSVIDPSTNTLLGEIVLGKPQTNILTALYKGQALVHGLGYSPSKKMLAVVAVGSNSVTLISTENNQIIKTIYLGRAPHEATFTPDGKEVWVTIRGEAYISVIDVEKKEETKQIAVSDGPGMVAFTPDNQFAYICSSFSPTLEIIDTKTYQIIKKIEIPSPFSPNIFPSPDGKLIGLTLKDIGKIVLIDTKTNEIVKLISTGPITNHVSFIQQNDKSLMLVTVGGESCVKVYDIAKEYKQIATIPVGQLPHGLWCAPDGKRAYIGLEFADQVQPIDLEKMTALDPIQIGQSPQALLYAPNAVSKKNAKENLRPLQDLSATQIIAMKATSKEDKAKGELSVRTIGASDLIEQLFLNLSPNTAYSLILSKSTTAPYTIDYEVNAFITDEKGKYAGQSTGLIKSRLAKDDEYKRVILIETNSNHPILQDQLKTNRY